MDFDAKLIARMLEAIGQTAESYTNTFHNLSNAVIICCKNVDGAHAEQVKKLYKIAHTEHGKMCALLSNSDSKLKELLNYVNSELKKAGMATVPVPADISQKLKINTSDNISINFAAFKVAAPDILIQNMKKLIADLETFKTAYSRATTALSQEHSATKSGYEAVPEIAKMLNEVSNADSAVTNTIKTIIDNANNAIAASEPWHL